jgi:hypothetical protein
MTTCPFTEGDLIRLRDGTGPLWRVERVRDFIARERPDLYPTPPYFAVTATSDGARVHFIVPCNDEYVRVEGER